MKRKEARREMQSVAKALSILLSFSQEKEWQGVTEISNELQLNKSTVHSILNTLASYGFIQQSPELKKYRLGLGIIKLAGTKLSQLDLVSASMPIMKDLMASTGETVVLTVLFGTSSLYLAKIDSPQPVRVASYVGGSGPIHCSANGKVLLAFRPESSWKEALPEKLERYTPRTITSHRLLREELRRTLERGYALDMEEYAAHLCAVAAPVRDASREVVAAIVVVGPSSRLGQKRLQIIAPEVMLTANRISAALGFSAP